MDINKPRRRWFQISLRTLLLLVTAASVGFGWVGYKLRQAQRQREAVEAIRKLGGTVWYDYEIVSGTVPQKARTAAGPACLQDWLGVDFFASATRVQRLGPVFSDVDLVHLQELGQLEFLDLNRAAITDAGLAHLQDLKRLEILYLTDTETTDVGLAHLRGLPRLEHLDLRGTHVTDAGLIHLEGLPRLRIVNLTNTQVTQQGRQELHKARPKLVIVR